MSAGQPPAMPPAMPPAIPGFLGPDLPQNLTKNTKQNCSIVGPNGCHLYSYDPTQLLRIFSYTGLISSSLLLLLPEPLRTLSFTKTSILLPPRPKTLSPPMLAKSVLATNAHEIQPLRHLVITEFLDKCQVQMKEWVSTVYRVEREVIRDPRDGTLCTTLPGDLFSLLEIEFSVLSKELSAADDLPEIRFLLLQVCVDALTSCQEQYIEGKVECIEGIEELVTDGNDFVSVAEGLGEFHSTILSLPEGDGDTASSSTTASDKKEKDNIYEETICALLSHVTSLFMEDAVKIGGMVVPLIGEGLEQELSSKFFSPEWLHAHTSNELMLSLVSTLEDYDRDLKGWLGTWLYLKGFAEIITLASKFYCRTFLFAVLSHSGDEPLWGEQKEWEKAARRMRDDVAILREYLSEKSMSTNLTAHFRASFTILDLLEKFLSSAPCALTFASPPSISSDDYDTCCLVLGEELAQYFIATVWRSVSAEGRKLASRR